MLLLTAFATGPLYPAFNNALNAISIFSAESLIALIKFGISFTSNFALPVVFLKLSIPFLEFLEFAFASAVILASSYVLKALISVTANPVNLLTCPAIDSSTDFVFSFAVLVSLLCL
ncbi:hypothetical protein [Borrelia hermsii]|uniref:hypothetical protein n=1 Tax=Borrelia hermsii TaxID=140 RepID=UPI000A7581FC|nr:hypothetical protein [Borrelia hermsii]